MLFVAEHRGVPGEFLWKRTENISVPHEHMDDEEQAEIQGWLEDVLGSPFPMGSTFEDCLASGARLCQVMNRLW